MCSTQTPTQELVASQLGNWLCALCLLAVGPVLLAMPAVVLYFAPGVLVQALLDSLLAQRFDDAALFARALAPASTVFVLAYCCAIWLARKRILNYLQSKHAVREATARLKATADQAAALFAAAVTLFAGVLARVTLALSFKPRITRDPPPPPLPARRLLHALLLPRIFSVSLRTTRA